LTSPNTQNKKSIHKNTKKANKKSLYGTSDAAVSDSNLITNE